MDPDTIIKRIIEAFNDKNTEEADEAIQEYSEWIQKGGFMPSEEALEELEEILVKFNT